jgi:hypothetical protein
VLLCYSNPMDRHAPFTGPCRPRTVRLEPGLCDVPYFSVSTPPGPVHWSAPIDPDRWEAIPSLAVDAVIEELNAMIDRWNGGVPDG